MYDLGNSVFKFVDGSLIFHAGLAIGMIVCGPPSLAFLSGSCSHLQFWRLRTRKNSPRFLAKMSSTACIRHGNIRNGNISGTESPSSGGPCCLDTENILAMLCGFRMIMLFDIGYDDANCRRI